MCNVAKIPIGGKRMSNVAPNRIAVTVKEAARLLSTNDKQIRRGIHARELPVVRFGNSYSIGVDDLRAWFNRKKATL